MVAIISLKPCSKNTTNINNNEQYEFIAARYCASANGKWKRK